MFNFLKRKGNDKIKELDLYAMTDGEVIAIEKVSDSVFAQKMMGDGFAIIPTDGTINSPIEGKVLNIFPTQHVIGIKSNDLEVLLHMGIDTVALEGLGFDTRISEGKKVNKDTVLSIVDLDTLEKEDKETTMIVVFTNGQDIIESFKLDRTGDVKRGEIIGKVLLK